MAAEWVKPEFGAWGWDHSKWQDNFYPDDLPADWQLTYYSNEFPLVLVPLAETGHLSEAEVIDWIEDVNEEFQFIVELPVSVEGMDQLGKLEEYVSAFSGTVLAGVVDLSSGDLPEAGVLEEICSRCAPILPLHVNLPAAGLPQAVQDMLAAYQPGYCWRSDMVDMPQNNGDLQIGIITSAGEQALPLPQLRQQIEQFRQASSTARQTVVLFKGSPPCVDDMNNAKVIAELL